MRTELVTWSEVDKLVDNLLPQIGEEIDLIVAVNPGGLVLAGILAEALAVAQVVLAEVSFPVVRSSNALKICAWLNGRRSRTSRSVKS